MQKEQAMSDNLRRYRAIRDALIQYYPGEPTGTVARHLTTLAALISGMVASKSTQLPKIATHVPDGRRPESRVKRFARWLRNDHITDAVYFVPYVELLLRHLAVQTLTRPVFCAMQGRCRRISQVGTTIKNGCTPSTIRPHSRREIWWCSVGVNIGHEMDGKNQFYNRPVLIVRKFNFGVPLTTKIKQNPYYLLIRFKDHDQCVMLSQLRLWDGKRLTHKMGQLPDDQFAAVKQALRRLLK